MGSAKKVTINPSSSDHTVGTTERWTLTTVPSPSSTTFTWSSSDESVATVDENGNVTYVGEGDVTITVTGDNGVTSSVTVTSKYGEATSVTINPASGDHVVNNSEQWSYTTVPSQTSTTFTWSSSNESVATVDQTGKVTYVGEGSVTITVTGDNGVKDLKTVKVLQYSLQDIIDNEDARETLTNYDIGGCVIGYYVDDASSIAVGKTTSTNSLMVAYSCASAIVYTFKSSNDVGEELLMDMARLAPLPTTRYPVKIDVTNMKNITSCHKMIDEENAYIPHLKKNNWS